jgi:hypothetical protein
MGSSPVSATKGFMDTMAEWCREHKIPLTEEQEVAALYLANHGYRFFCEFGYENVISVADDVFDKECAKVRK